MATSEVELTVKRKELKPYEESDDKILWEKDSAVMKAKYDYYIFDKAALEAALGEEDRKALKLRLVARTERAADDSGIRVIYWTAEIVA